MPKSRNRSRDIRRRAEKKREKREKIAHHLKLIARQSTAMLNEAEKLRLQNDR